MQWVHPAASTCKTLGEVHAGMLSIEKCRDKFATRVFATHSEADRASTCASSRARGFDPRRPTAARYPDIPACSAR
ncbi:hypothetical protein BCEN4_330074 [Burkholderia cenocepacia]|nr:hypothetical protein BCEN4_330074 [Burkholderia cenocepacia]